MQSAETGPDFGLGEVEVLYRAHLIRYTYDDRDFHLLGSKIEDHATG